LVLYTDGVTEAQNAQGEFFGLERLLQLARANLGRTAADVKETILADVEGFTGSAPPLDDIALLVVVRD
jgi:sigma-B regulation protein RsbU (phosphoserine phosphatase)